MGNSIAADRSERFRFPRARPIVYRAFSGKRKLAATGTAVSLRLLGGCRPQSRASSRLPPLATTPLAFPTFPLRQEAPRSVRNSSYRQGFCKGARSAMLAVAPLVQAEEDRKETASFWRW